MKKKWTLMVVFAVSLLPGGFFQAVAANAGVNLNITIPLPGPEAGPPPAMVVVPGTYVYYAPDAGVDLFFYRGYWYRPYRGNWYFSAEYAGPWGRVAVGSVPYPLINLPPAYRNAPPGYERMPYHIVRQNWRRWEKERYWDSYQRGDEQGMGHHGRGMGMGGMGMGR